METDTLMDQEELAEIQALLPDFTAKTIVQLGLGFGCRQLTAFLAQKASKVIIYLSGEEITEETKDIHKDYINIECINVTDVQEISCPDSSVDLLFSNWLSNDIGNLLKKQLSWLKPDGYLFLRDSYEATSSDQRVCETSPSLQRNFETYETLVSSLLVLSDDYRVYGFDVVSFKTMDATPKTKSVKNSTFILLQKTVRDDSCVGAKEFGKCDEYKISCILLYEKAFDYNFLSLGGEEITKEIVSLLDLKPGENVLDVGGGIGGSAFYLVKNCRVSVTSVDISPSVNLLGQKRAREAGIGPDQIVFETVDATQMGLSP